MKVNLTKKKLVFFLILSCFIMPFVYGIKSLIWFFFPTDINVDTLSTVSFDVLAFTVGWFLISIPFLIIFGFIGLKNYKSNIITLNIFKIIDVISFITTLFIFVIVCTFIFDIITGLTIYSILDVFGYSLTLFPVICCNSIFIDSKLNKRKNKIISQE